MGHTHALSSCWSQFNHPKGISPRNRTLTIWLGRIGFFTKGFVYATLGGLTIKTASDPPGEDNASPQGVFILVGFDSSIGFPLLICLGAGLVCYAAWRFLEAFSGQGASPSRSKSSNFFKYRLSPFVSGCVYLGYLYYIIQLLIRRSHSGPSTKPRTGTTGSAGPPTATSSSSSSSCFPSCWKNSAAGLFGLFIFGFAFVIATITQIIPAVTGQFEQDLKTYYQCEPIPNWVRRAIHIMGRIGFAARALVFALVASLFFASMNGATNPSANNGQDSTVAIAINQLVTTGWGRAILYILGIGLIDYGIFAALNSYYKYFPTVPVDVCVTGNALDSLVMGPHKLPNAPTGGISSERDEVYRHAYGNDTGLGGQGFSQHSPSEMEAGVIDIPELRRPESVHYAR